MALNLKFVAITVLFSFAVVLLAQFGSAFWIEMPAQTAFPPAGAWLNASSTNNSVFFGIILKTNVTGPNSENCAFNGSVNGVRLPVAPENITVYNITTASNYTNVPLRFALTPGEYRWHIMCTERTEGFSNYTNTSFFYFDPNLTINDVTYPTANAVLRALQTPFQVSINETTWNSTNITGVKYYFTTGSTSTANTTLFIRTGTWTVNVSIINETNPYALFNFSVDLFNFSDIHTQPGVHSVTVCSNDTANNENCSAAQTYNVLLANATAVQEHYRVNFGAGTLSNVSFENVTNIAPADFINLTHKNDMNLTLRFNTSGATYANVVGVTFDNLSILNITSFNMTITPNNNFVTNISNLGFNATIGNMSWLDIPANVLSADFKYGEFKFLSTGAFDAYFYCNGTRAQPNCYRVTTRCNYENINTSTDGIAAIPATGCYNVSGGATANITIYTRTFSGVAATNDTVPPFFANNSGSGFRRGNYIANATATDRNSGMGVNVATMYYRWENATDTTAPGPWSVMSNITSTLDFNATLNTATLSDGLYQIRINVTDSAGTPNMNSTVMIFGIKVDNNAPTNNTVFPAAGVNYVNLSFQVSANWTDAFWNASNIDVNGTQVWYYIDTAATNTTLSNVTSLAAANPTAVYNVTPVINFSSTNTNPGVHTINYCANDTIGNLRCTSASFTIRVANATQVREIYAQRNGPFANNLTFENGAAIGADSMVTVRDEFNYTLQVNASARSLLSIVGFTVNITTANMIHTGNNLTILVNENWTSNITNYGFNVSASSGDLAWMDINGTVLNQTDYKFGRVDLTSQYDAYFYCNGTWNVPSCYRLSACSLTPNVTDFTAIPSGSGCYVEISSNVATIFTDTLSGGAGSNDTFAPFTTNNTGVGFRRGTITVNVTVQEVNQGTGVNNSRAYYRWENFTDPTSGPGAWTQMSNESTIFNRTLDTTTVSDGLYRVRINVSDNARTPNVNTSFLILELKVDNTGPINGSATFPAALNNYDNISFQVTANWTDTFWNATNLIRAWYYIDTATTNTTLNNVTSLAAENRYAIYNVTPVINFSSTNTNPGVHTINYCANDTIGNLSCFGASFTIRVANATQVREQYNQKTLGAFVHNLTFESGSLIGADSMTAVMDSFNYTIQFNRTANKFLSVIGLTLNYTTINYIDDGNNVTIQSNANWTSNMTNFGFNMTFGELAWLDLNSTMANSTLYKYGKIDLPAQYDGYFYCNGTWAQPNCYKITTCAAPTLANHGSVIPRGNGCFVRSGSTLVTIYTDTLSGGAGANDTVPPSVVINSPSSLTSFNMTFNLNLTITDVNSGSGVNSTTVYWRYENSTFNSTWFLMSNISNSEYNYTVNVTISTIADGNYTVRVNASDLAVAPNTNATGVLNSIVFDDTLPSCSLTQTRTDTIRQDESLLASDFRCSASENIGISSIVISGLTTSSTGTKTATCTVNDTASNKNSCTTTYEVFSKAAGGGGGGGGGGGSIGESSSTIVIGDIAAGESKTITGIDTKSNVEQIVLETTQLVSSAKVTVSSLSDKPATIASSPEGRAYKYLEIRVPEITDDSIVKKAEITFKVENKWLADNKLDKSSVRLTRFHGDMWQKLTTALSNSDSTHTYYRAETPGFSTFAIVAEKTVSGAPAVEPKKEEPKATTTTTTTTQPSRPQQASQQQIAGIVVLLIIIAGIAYFVTQKQKGGGGGKASSRWRKR